MPARHRSNGALSQQTLDIAAAVPKVVAHRMIRLALAGWQPNQRDRREFKRMSDEKLQAFQESWQAMGRASQSWPFDLWQQWMHLLWTPWWLQHLHGSSLGVPWFHEATRILSHGAEPLRRRAVANARRLGGTSLR